jgi:hypothetical protein
METNTTMFEQWLALVVLVALGLLLLDANPMEMAIAHEVVPGHGWSDEAMRVLLISLGLLIIIHVVRGLSRRMVDVRSLGTVGVLLWLGVEVGLPLLTWAISWVWAYWAWVLLLVGVGMYLIVVRALNWAFTGGLDDAYLMFLLQKPFLLVEFLYVRVLARGWGDINANVVGTDNSLLLLQCSKGNSRNVALLLAVSQLNPNLPEPSKGRTPLCVAAFHGNDDCVKLLLADERVDPNLADFEGFTPLSSAASEGQVGCLRLLLSDARVDVNQAITHGETPLFVAANTSADRCAELLLADSRVDVTRASATGQTPLAAACMQLMTSMNQVGAPGDNDPTRCLVLMLKSRRIPKHNLKKSITYLGPAMPTRREIDRAEAGGEPLEPVQKMARLIIPVLLAQLKGEFRWCAHCLKLTPDVDLNRCGGCKQVGYCEPDPTCDALLGKKPCHEAHWKAHKKECKKFAAEANAEVKAEAEVAKQEGGTAGGMGGGECEGGAEGVNRGEDQKKRGGGKKNKGSRKG